MKTMTMRRMNGVNKVKEKDRALKERVEKWRRFMLENPPPEPKEIALVDECDEWYLCGQRCLSKSGGA